MCCHQHTEKDFELQLKIAEAELEEYNNTEDLPVVDDLIKDNRANQVRFLRSIRYHHNAWCCYWFWMHKQSDKNLKKTTVKRKPQK